MKIFKLTALAASMLIISGPGFAADIDDDITIRVIEDLDRGEHGARYLELPDVASQRARDALERVRERDHDSGLHRGRDEGRGDGHDEDRDQERDDDRGDSHDQDREQERDQERDQELDDGHEEDRSNEHHDDRSD